MSFSIDTRLIRKVRQSQPITSQPLIYWMSRDMRVSDNWALLYAIQLANTYNTTLRVVYHLQPTYLGGGQRQLLFKKDGLIELHKRLADLGIPLILTLDNPIQLFKDSCHIVTDMSPLRTHKHQLIAIEHYTTVPIDQVDAHNIIPVWVTSNKQEFAAYTIRPKIHRLLDEFLTPFPVIQLHKRSAPQPLTIHWDKLIKKTPTYGPALTYWKGGETAAQQALHDFIDKRLLGYATDRNNPTIDGVSGLSPYLHYGMISAQRIALSVIDAKAPSADKDAFLEEMIVRRELADNYCWYTDQYDSLAGAPQWAQDTLSRHARDTREYIYSFEEFEQAATHDDLWNAAQKEMVFTGKMHGYMRMYWAKKILEWTPSAQDALRIAIALNDRYELDGRDPNGYVGCLWSIAGLHDRAWFERDVFGTIRYMNANGCRRKFDVDGYCRKNR